jgi:hypothetical protein
MINSVNLIEFCKYVQPIVSGCAGFIRTNGYMLHQPGVIVMMSADETFVSIIKIPVIFDLRITAIIGDFIKLKDDSEMLNLFDNIYFTGWNIKEDHLKRYLSDYITIDEWDRCIFQEEDCFNLQGFDIGMKSSDIGYINILDRDRFYRVPVSKSITNVSKSDKCGIKIYDYLYDTNHPYLKTVKYTIFKKKFKLNVEVFCNIILL